MLIGWSQLSDGHLTIIGVGLSCLLIGVLVGSGRHKELYQAAKEDGWSSSLLVIGSYVALLVYAWQFLVLLTAFFLVFLGTSLAVDRAVIGWKALLARIGR